MTFWEWWANIRKKNLQEVFDDDSDEEAKEEIKRYLLFLAHDICANFIAKQVSQSEFKTKRENWYYTLNVRPNTDMSATQFWERFTYDLIVKNQVLVVKSDTNDLLIADSWVRKEYALYEDIFEGVSVKGYQFNRHFKMNEVFYLEYSTNNLRRAINGLFEDYSVLFSKLTAAIGRNSQIRGTVDVRTTGGSFDKDKREQLQKVVRKLFKSFGTDTVAIAPLTDGLEYKEHSNTTGTSNINVDELIKLKNDLIDTAADVLGIPTALLHGNRAELADNMTAFNDYCLPPLLKKIEDELNAKTMTRLEYSEDSKIEVIGVNKPNIFKLSDAIDKLISSGAFNANEIRKELGHDPREGGDEYVRTKNYEKEGGEEK